MRKSYNIIGVCRRWANRPGDFELWTRIRFNSIHLLFRKFCSLPSTVQPQLLWKRRKTAGDGQEGNEETIWVPVLRLPRCRAKKREQKRVTLEDLGLTLGSSVPDALWSADKSRRVEGWSDCTGFLQKVGWIFQFFFSVLIFPFSGHWCYSIGQICVVFGEGRLLRHAFPFRCFLSNTTALLLFLVLCCPASVPIEQGRRNLPERP